MIAILFNILLVIIFLLVNLSLKQNVFHNREDHQ